MKFRNALANAVGKILWFLSSETIKYEVIEEYKDHSRKEYRYYYFPCKSMVLVDKNEV